MALKVYTTEKKPMFFEIGIAGRLDTHTYEQLQAAIDIIFETNVRGVTLDLSALEYISSMGLRVIMQTAKKAKAACASVVITNPQPQVKAILDIAKALPAESIFTSTEEADRYFDAIQKKTLEEEQQSE